MVWCETCIAAVDSDHIGADGACPTCGSIIVTPTKPPRSAKFWLLIGGTGIYLVWRIWQLIEWLAR